MRRPLALIVLLLSVRAVHAQVLDNETEWVRWARDAGTEWLSHDVAVPAELKIDAEARGQAERVGARQVERMRVIWERWAQAQWRRVPAAERPRLTQRLNAYYLNQRAAMHMQTLGEDGDRLMLAAWQRPSYCRLEPERGWFADTAVAVSQLPPQERAALWAAQDAAWERQVSGAALPMMAVPEIPLSRAIQEKVASWTSQVVRGGPAMTPVLAWSRLVRRKSDAITCSVRQWWLQHALLSPGAEGRSLAEAIRYDTLPLPTYESPPAGQPADGYPVAAMRHGVEGVLQVHARLAGGRLQNPVVASRRITVPGLEGERPIAFETIFDEQTLARARQARQEGPDADRVTVEFVWRLQ
jgi:hypothetical protein